MEKEDKIKLQKAIEQSLGEQWEVKPITVAKTNGSKEGLQCRHEGDTHAFIVYLDDFSELYLSGEPMADIGKYAASVIEEKRAAMPELTVLPSPEKFQEGLFIQMVNAEKNEEMLKNVVHDTFGDMAAIVRCKVAEEEDGIYSFKVKKDNLVLFKMTEGEVLERAYQNTATQKFQVWNTTDIMREVLERQIEAGEVSEIQREVMEEMLSKESPLYVMSNPERMNGANVVMCQEALHKAYGDFGEPYYILPSSVHEVMLVKESENIDIGVMKDMVRAANESAVKPEELLSYEVFRYDGRKLSIAREDVQKVSETVDKVKHHKWTM